MHSVYMCRHWIGSGDEMYIVITSMVLEKLTAYT